MRRKLMIGLAVGVLWGGALAFPETATAESPCYEVYDECLDALDDANFLERFVIGVICEDERRECEIIVMVYAAMAGLLN